MLGLAILSEAVERYKELCEGKYCGKFVDRVQVIRGVEFFYSPPPRSAVPFAAALRPERSAASSPTGDEYRTQVQYRDISSTSVAQKENLTAAIAAAKSASGGGHGQSLAPMFLGRQLTSGAFNGSSTPSLDSATLSAGAGASASALAAALVAAGHHAVGRQALLPLSGNHSMAPNTPFIMHDYINASAAINSTVPGQYSRTSHHSGSTGAALETGNIFQNNAFNLPQQQQQFGLEPGSLAYAAIYGLDSKNESPEPEIAVYETVNEVLKKHVAELKEETAHQAPAPAQTEKEHAAAEYSLFGPSPAGKRNSTR